MTGPAIDGLGAYMPCRRATLFWAVAGLVLDVTPGWSQSINLSAIAAGTGPGFVLNGQTANDRSGYSVASAGDVNGDGLADLIIGAITADTPGALDAGRAYVVFGKSSPGAINLSAIAAGTGGFVLNGQSAGDFAGTSASSAGDVNGDGLADVIVGAQFVNLFVGADAGRSYVIFGRTSTTALALSSVASGTGGFAINGQGPGDRAGISVSSAGDVNGDGLGDMVVGAFYSTLPSMPRAGRAYVVFGKTTTASINLADVESGTGGFAMTGQASGDLAGVSVCGAGDVNGDGLADVIVGAVEADGPAGTNAGRSYVVFGKSSTGTVALSAVVAGTGGFAIEGEAPSDFSGRSVGAAGDVNGDGLADLIVGAVEADPLGETNAGRCYVVFGKTSTGSVSLSAITVGTGGFVINGQVASDFAGRSVSPAGDVNGDGLGDVLVGANRSDPPTGIDAGRCYLVLGKTDTSGVDLSAVVAGSGGFALDGQAPDDRSGQSTAAAGDVNGDGLADVIVGADRSDPAAGSNAGRSYVVFSPYTPATTAAYRGQVAVGNPNRQGIGIHRFGDDATIFPDSRAWVDFDAGSGPGLAGSSEVVATITRNDVSLTGFDPLTTANVQWQFTTDRTGWAACRVTVRYTDAEIAGLAEGSLVLYTAPTVAGPFVPAANFTLTPTRNEAAGEVASMPAVFVLSTVPPGVFPLDGDANDDGSIDIADVTAIHNDLAGIASLTPDGVANLANIGGVSVAAADALLDHLANGAPLP